MNRNAPTFSYPGFIGVLLILFSWALYDWVSYFGSEQPDISGGRTFLIPIADAPPYVWPALGWAYTIGIGLGLFLLAADFLLRASGKCPARWAFPPERLKAQAANASRGQRIKSVVVRLLLGVALGMVVFVGTQSFVDQWWVRALGAVAAAAGVFWMTAEAGIVWGLGDLISVLCIGASLGLLKLVWESKLVLLFSPPLMTLGLGISIIRLLALQRKYRGAKSAA